MVALQTLARCSILCALLAASTAPALAQDAVLGPDELRKRFKTLAGKSVTVEAKYKECWGGSYVKTVDGLKFYLVRGSKLSDQLRNNRDAKDQPLVHDVSNILLMGKIINNEGALEEAPRGLVFQLENLLRIADDIPRFNAQLERAVKESPNDERVIHAVADEAKLWARRYRNDELKRWAIECDRRALTVKEGKIAADDVDAWLKIAAEYVERIAARPHAIALLDKLYRRNKDKKVRNRINVRLEALGAYFYEDKWIPFEDFKRQEGFYRRTIEGVATWLRREELEFLDVIAEDRKRIEPLGYTLDAMYSRAAEKGQIKISMRPNHVVAVRVRDGRLGFPERVDRKRVVIGSETRIYEQWVYPDQQRFYFVDGRLFLHKDAIKPWPDQ